MEIKMIRLKKSAHFLGSSMNHLILQTLRALLPKLQPASKSPRGLLIIQRFFFSKCGLGPEDFRF